MKNISLVTGFLGSLCLISLNLFADNAAFDSQADNTLTERYSDKVIFRPGIMPVGIINFDSDVTIKSKKHGDDIARSTNLGIATQFGIVPKVQGEISYSGAYPFKSSDGNRASNSVTLATKYNYLSLPHTSLSAIAKLPMNIWSGDEIVKETTIGLPVVFYNDIMAGSILGDVFTLYMRPTVAAKFDFPFWYGVQIYGNFWAQVNSSFGYVELKNENNQSKGFEGTPFWKELPATLNAIYVINHYFDVMAIFGFNDTLKAKETMKFGLGFSIRGGSIFG